MGQTVWRSVAGEVFCELPWRRPPRGLLASAWPLPASAGRERGQLCCHLRVGEVAAQGRVGDGVVVGERPQRFAVRASLQQLSIGP